MPVDHFLMPRPELLELQGLHLLEVNHPAPLNVGQLEAMVQPFQLDVQQLVVGLPGSGIKRGLPLHQEGWPEQGRMDLNRSALGGAE